MGSSGETILSRFGGVYENTPWICEGALGAGLVTEAVRKDVSSCLPPILLAYFEQNATAEQKIDLLTSYPDLAGKLAAAKQLSADSETEHKSAGLDQCTPDELAEFQKLNGEYTNKFNFPFIVAVVGYDRHGILELFRRRIGNDKDAEIKEAITQVHRIAKIRIERECATMS